MTHSTIPPESGDLGEAERRVVDAIFAQRMTATHYDLLGLRRDADRRAVRDAYFALSKRFHPDVYFNRDIGGYRQRFEELFRMFTRAYDVLGNPKQRAGYDLHLANLGDTRVEPSIPEVVAVLRSSAANAPPARTSATGTPVVTGTVQAGAQSPLPTSIEGAVRPARMPSIDTLPPPTSTRAINNAETALREGAVLPPPLKTSPSQPAPGQSLRPSQPAAAVDPHIRQRALEAMARRLSAAVPGGGPVPGRSSSRQTPIVTAEALAAERNARLTQLLAQADEAQKTGDFDSALDALKGALTIRRDDQAIKLKIDAVEQVIRARRVDENIAKARDAMHDGKPLDAASFWEKAWDGRRTDAQLLLNAAEILSRFTSESKRAAELAQRVISIDPKMVKGHVLLAQIFVKAGLKASAQGALARLEELDPNSQVLKELKEQLGPKSLAERLNFRIR